MREKGNIVIGSIKDLGPKAAELESNFDKVKDSGKRRSFPTGKKKIREFSTGATRDTDEGKPDYEAYFSPLVFVRFGEYMTKHRKQPDGTIRDGDNWQKGIPKKSYIKSGWRHMVDLWLHHRGYEELAREGIEEACCAILFFIQGYLHEHLKEGIKRRK